MRLPLLKDLGLVVLLVSLGVVARIAFQDIPNFAPVAAISLFSGYVFAHFMAACCVPLLVMLISDRLMDAGGYPLPLMLSVYGLLAMPVLFSFFGQRLYRSKTPGTWTLSCGMAGCSLLSSLLFFLGTNAMVWVTGGLYEPTWSGLMSCFLHALPFFRYTLAGDVIFGVTLFGAYAISRSAVVGARPSATAHCKSV